MTFLQGLLLLSAFIGLGFLAVAALRFADWLADAWAERNRWW